MREKSNHPFPPAAGVRHVAVILSLAVLAASLPAAPAQAESLSAHLATVAEAVGLSAIFALTAAEEQSIINTSWKAYLLQQKNKPVPRVGQVSIDGSYPTEFVLTGESGVATFHYVDTTTELPAGGPLVDTVVYEWDTDPTNPVSWVLLGSSTNPLDDFAIPFTTPGPNPYEPLIRATPYFEGSPVVILGVDDENVAVGIAAVLVPEPASIMLLGSAILALCMACRRRGLPRLR